LAGRKRRGGIAAALLALHRTDQPVRLLQERANLLRFLGVRDFDFLLALAEQSRIELWRLGGGKRCINRPVFFLLERLELALPLDNQAQSNGLNTSCGQAASDFIPE